MSDLLKSKSITPLDIGLLQFCKLNTAPTEYVTNIIQTYIFDSLYESTEYTVAEVFEKREWIKYIKTGKKDPVYRIRLSDKGEEIIKSLSQKPPHELAEECWTILETEYKNFEIEKTKIVNKSKTTHFISEWLYCKEEEGKPYTTKMFRALVIAYLSSFEYEKKKFVHKTLNLLFKSENVYASKFNKDSSPLYQFSILSAESVKNTYRKLYS